MKHWYEILERLVASIRATLDGTETTDVYPSAGDGTARATMVANEIHAAFHQNPTV